jgi:hypothetical protein
MDDLEIRLRDRMERLSDAVPVAPAHVATSRVVRAPGVRGQGRRLGLAAAIAAVVIAAVGAAALGSGLLGEWRKASATPSAPLASVPSSAATSPGPTASPSAAPASPSAEPSGGAPSPSQSAAAVPSEDAWPRYADGIPSMWAGSPVLRGGDALVMAARLTAAGDTTPFLIGGWLSVVHGVFGCTLQPSGLAHWATQCNGAYLSDQAGGGGVNMAPAITFSLLDNGLANPVDGLKTSPVIVRVHVHDPRASKCTGDNFTGGSNFATCDGMMIAEEILWTGDAVTAPRPISAEQALAAITSVDPAAALVADGPDVARQVCVNEVPSAQEYLLEATPPFDAVTALQVLPTTAARQQAVPLPTGPAGTWSDKGQICAGFATSGTEVAGSEDRELVVANVAVMIHVRAPATAKDRAFVVRLADALTAAAAQTAPTTFRQPTVHVPDGAACSGIGTPGAKLAGDARDPRVAWLVLSNGETRPAVFPDTLSIRFAPEIQVVDGAGDVVLRAGQAVDGACGGDGGPLLILWP